MTELFSKKFLMQLFLITYIYLSQSTVKFIDILYFPKIANVLILFPTFSVNNILKRT